MKYLLDTNACIALLNADPLAIRSRFDKEAGRDAELFVPSVVLFELWYGVARSARQQANAEFLDGFLRGPVVVLSLDGSDAKAGSQIRAALEKAGTPIGSYDYLIAGQAMNRNLTLVTANEREFRRVKGLRVENWAK